MEKNPVVGISDGVRGIFVFRGDARGTSKRVYHKASKASHRRVRRIKRVKSSWNILGR